MSIMAGGTSGRVPFGYRRGCGVGLVEEAKESRSLIVLFELFVQYRRKGAVARGLNALGHKTRKGSKWSDMAVGRILSDSVYGEIAKTGQIPQIINQNLWEQVQDILSEQGKGVGRPGRTPRHLFSGKVRCHCGTMMYKPANTPKYVCKSCRNKIPIEDLERIYTNELRPFWKESGGSETLIEHWNELPPEDKQRIIDTTVVEVVIKDGNAVEFTFSYAPFPKDVENSQQEEYPTDRVSGSEEKKPEGSSERQQISTREAANRLGYHPKTLLKNASKWGLTKIYMSKTNVFFFEDEVEDLVKSRSFRG